MIDLKLIPLSEFNRINNSTRKDKYDKLHLIADMCRANTLVAVKKAGSGHLGIQLQLDRYCCLALLLQNEHDRNRSG